MSSYPNPDRNVTSALKLPFHLSWGTAQTIDRHIIVLYPKIERLCYHGTGIGQSSKIGGLERLKKSDERRATVYDH